MGILYIYICIYRDYIGGCLYRGIIFPYSLRISKLRTMSKLTTLQLFLQATYLRHQTNPSRLEGWTAEPLAQKSQSKAGAMSEMGELSR